MPEENDENTQAQIRGKYKDEFYENKRRKSELVIQIYQSQSLFKWGLS